MSARFLCTRRQNFFVSAFSDHRPFLELLEGLDQEVEVDRTRGVQIVLVGMRKSILLRRQ